MLTFPKEIFHIYQAFFDTILCYIVPINLLVQMSNLPEHISLDTLVETFFKMLVTLQTSGTNGSLSELHCAMSNSTIPLESHG